MSFSINQNHLRMINNKTDFDNNTIPAKKEAKKQFWGLEERFWKQIIDGKFHHLGPMVFDEALHHGEKEPGYFNSMTEGCKYASKHLTEKPSLEFYKNLHKTLCTHFKGRETNTAEAGAAGVFRYGELYDGCSFNLKCASKEIENHYYNIRSFEAKHILNLMKDNFPEKYIRICNEYADSKQFVVEFESYCKEKTEKINAHLTKLAKKINIPKFAEVEWSSSDIWECRGIFRIDYLGEGNNLKTIVNYIFSCYNQKKDELNNQLQQTTDDEIKKQIIYKKIKNIAKTYQDLEWTHPFPDGQGRTDLVLLSKLLCDEGFHPSILTEPYLSSYSTLSEWTDYLIEGMKLWEIERQNK